MARGPLSAADEIEKRADTGRAISRAGFRNRFRNTVFRNRFRNALFCAPLAVTAHAFGVGHCNLADW